MEPVVAADAGYCRAHSRLRENVAEASTGYPNDLAVARKAGHCGHLEPSKTGSAEVKAIAYSDFASVKRIEPDGTVIGDSI